MKKLEDTILDSNRLNFLNNRHYAIPCNGVILKVIDRSSNFDSILVNETQTSFTVILNLKVNENIVLEEDIKEKTIPIVIEVNKRLLSENNLNGAIMPKTLGVRSPDEDTLYIQMVFLALASIYIVIYDNKALLEEFTIHRNVGYDSSSYSARTSNYRIGHIRRLPIHQKMSPMALENAKKEGFLFILKGRKNLSICIIHNQQRIYFTATGELQRDTCSFNPLRRTEAI